MSEIKKNLAAELSDDELDTVSGGAFGTLQGNAFNAASANVNSNLLANAANAANAAANAANAANANAANAANVMASDARII